VSTIDLDNPPPNHNYRVSVNPEETRGERCVRLAKEVGVLLFAAVFVGSIFLVAINTVTSPSAGADEKKWAMSVLSAGAGGFVGYMVRK
jgi:hypothetical protein